MRLIRPLLIVAAVIWFFFAFLHWRTEVPLSPAMTFDPADGRVFLGFTPNGELLLARHEALEGQRRGITKGPVEVWSFPDGVKQREIFTKDDIIESVAVEPFHPTIIHRDGQPWIADLATGQLQHQLPARSSTFINARLAGPTRVVWTFGDVTTCFDLVEQREVWQLPGHSFPLLMSPRFAIYQHSLPLTTPRTGMLNVEVDAVDLATGKVDERLKPHQYRDLSPDGRRAVVTSGNKLQVIDLETANLVWESDGARTPYFNAKFSPSGEELIVDSVARDGDILTARIDAATGEVIEPGQGLRPTYMSAVQPSITSDRRFAIYHYARPPSWMTTAVRELQMKIVDWTMKAPQPLQARQEMAVFDLASHRRLGFLNDTNAKIVLSPSNTAFAISNVQWPGPERSEIHSLPPRMNWRWLIQYAVLPPLILIGVTRLLGRRGRESSAPFSEPAPPALKV